AAGAGAEFALQLTEERGVEIDALVVRTIERSRRRLREAAGRLNLSVKQAKPRRFIRRVVLPEDLFPAILGLAEHAADEATDLVRRPAGRTRRFAACIELRIVAAHALDAADQQARIDPKKPAEQSQHDDRADADAAATARYAKAAAAT